MKSAQRFWKRWDMSLHLDNIQVLSQAAEILMQQYNKIKPRIPVSECAQFNDILSLKSTTLAHTRFWIEQQANNRIEQ